VTDTVTKKKRKELLSRWDALGRSMSGLYLTKMLALVERRLDTEDRDEQDDTDADAQLCACGSYALGECELCNKTGGGDNDGSL
jgi:hypothetical protein